MDFVLRSTPKPNTHIDYINYYLISNPFVLKKVNGYYYEYNEHYPNLIQIHQFIITDSADKFHRNLYKKLALIQ